MNPKPFVASNHFTVPVFTKIPLIKNNKSGCDRIGKRVMLPTGDQYATPTSPRVERVLPSAFVPPSRDENRELPVCPAACAAAHGPSPAKQHRLMFSLSFWCPSLRLGAVVCCVLLCFLCVLFSCLVSL